MDSPEKIARYYHHGQKDTVNGDDYIRHIERVVSRVGGADAKSVAWLHDVIEDTPITADDLRAAGIPNSIVLAIVLLTKRDGEVYSDYIQAIKQSGNALAIAVKLADLEDHLHPNCPGRLRPRYEKAKQALLDTDQPTNQ